VTVPSPTGSRRTLGASPGATVLLNGEPTQVLGVMPAWFRFDDPQVDGGCHFFPPANDMDNARQRTSVARSRFEDGVAARIHVVRAGKKWAAHASTCGSSKRNQAGITPRTWRRLAVEQTWRPGWRRAAPRAGGERTVTRWFAPGLLRCRSTGLFPETTPSTRGRSAVLRSARMRRGSPPATARLRCVR